MQLKNGNSRFQSIPGSSRYVNFLPFGRFFGWKGTNFTHLEDPGIKESHWVIDFYKNFIGKHSWNKVVAPTSDKKAYKPQEIALFNGELRLSDSGLLEQIMFISWSFTSIDVQKYVAKASDLPWLTYVCSINQRNAEKDSIESWKFKWMLPTKSEQKSYNFLTLHDWISQFSNGEFHEESTVFMGFQFMARLLKKHILGGGFKDFLCSPLPGEMIQFN